MKRKLYWQPDVFWEDEKQSSEWIISKYFDVARVGAEAVLEKRLDFALLRGSLDIARRTGRDMKFAEVTGWLPPLRDFAVNSGAIFTDFKHAGEIILEREAKFIKSNSPFKEVSGEVFDYDRWSTEYQYLKQKNISPDSLLVCVAEPVHIVREYRTVFVNGELAGCSKYLEAGELCVEQGAPKEAQQFAREVAAQPFFQNRFDFVIDVGLVGDDWRLVEVNAFETSSFYAADLDEIYSRWATSFEIADCV